MRPIIILIVLCLIGKSVQKVEFYELETVPVYQVSCMRSTLKQFYELYNNVIVFAAKMKHTKNVLFKVPIVVATKWDSLHKILSVDTSAIIIFLQGNSHQDFNDLKSLEAMATVKPILIVCIADMVCGSEMYVKKFFELTFNGELHYVTVGDEGIIDIYEYTTKVEGSCGIGQLSKYSNCALWSKSKKNIFRKQMNFHKCPLRLITLPLQSHSTFNSNSKALRKLDEQMVKIIAEKLNATPVFFTVQTAQDVRYLAANRFGDMGFGTLYNKIYDGISYAQPYNFIDATIIAPYSAWAAASSSFSSILMPFEYQVWLGIGAVVISVIILRRLIPYFRKTYLLHLYSMLLGIAVPRKPRRLPNRIFFLSLVVFAYVISQAYLSHLTKVLATPSKLKILTLNDLENSETQVIGTAVDRELFKNDYPRIYSNFQAKDISDYRNELHELLKGRSNSLVFVQDAAVNIAKWKNVVAVRNRFNWFPVSFVTPNSSAILKSVNRILRKMNDSGFNLLYGFRLSKESRLTEYQVATVTRAPAHLRLSELYNVFVLISVGWSISFFVFVIELTMAYTKERIRQLMERINIRSKWFRQRYVSGILLPRQRSRGRRY